MSQNSSWTCDLHISALGCSTKLTLRQGEFGTLDLDTV